MERAVERDVQRHVDMPPVEIDDRRARTAAGPRTSMAAAARLHEACVAAARYYVGSGPVAAEVPDAALIALRRAVHEYVAFSKSEGLAPERALVLVKDVVRSCAPHVGHARSELLLRAVVFDAFLSSYFPEGRRRSGLGNAMLSPSQWATLGELR